MASNGFGKLFKFTTWGESHGPAIGCIIDGVPPLIPLTEDDIQFYLDKRKPGQSRFTTQRKEPDSIKILSGVFNGQTTGTPIGLIIENQDQRSKDYGDIKDKFRPGHADYTYEKKYGIRDYRGGGRSSARETAMRVAAGAIARKIIAFRTKTNISIQGALVQVGPHKIDREKWDWDEIDRNPFWSPDPNAAIQWSTFLDSVRKSGSSAGAIIELVATGVPVGLGEPIYGKIDSDLAGAMMSINAVKAVEIGAGFDIASIPGEKASDEMRIIDGEPSFLSNTAGGILGGITTGQPVIVRFAVKPTSSILSVRKSIDKNG
ncbi:MAG: chorismate synthase, partial [Rhodospirillaceae bacterium]|nr:chorismate synthase [Rhodospirillaceae bacterium]